MTKEELKITQQDKLLLQEMRENCLKADVYDDEKRLLKANAITKFLYLPQENKELKEIIKEVREYTEELKPHWLGNDLVLKIIDDLLQILDKVKEDVWN